MMLLPATQNVLGKIKINDNFSNTCIVIDELCYLMSSV